MINDAKLLDSFWTLVEHLLNTILFLLGGAVWGTVIADGEKTGVFTARDWGKLAPRLRPRALFITHSSIFLLPSSMQLQVTSYSFMFH